MQIAADAGDDLRLSTSSGYERMRARLNWLRSNSDASFESTCSISVDVDAYVSGNSFAMP